MTDGEYAHARDEHGATSARPMMPATTPAPLRRRRPAAAIVLAIALPALAFAIYAVFGDPAAHRRAAIAARAPAARVPTPPCPARRARPRTSHATRATAAAGCCSRAWTSTADRFADAPAAYGKALAVSPKVAADPAIWCEYADALGMAQGGTLAGRPRELVMHALTLDPTHPKALEMAGSAAYEQREYHSAAGYWRALLAQIPRDARRERRELARGASRAPSAWRDGARSGLAAGGRGARR